jgi:2-C-methyl-D-erythritol 4-phosphate cytidylyltransferase
VPGGVWAVVVAAGTGDRFGSLKQFAPLGARPAVAWSLAAARPVVDGVVLVVPASPAPDASPLEAREAADVVVPGGDTRADSVRCGLAAVPDDAEIVVVHDGARPLASAALFRSVVAAVRAGADGAVPALPVVDTVKRVDGDRVVGTVDRGDLVAVQTPQAFRAGALRRAHRGGDDATDDAGLVERGGGTVVVVPGEVRNVKLTTASDLEVAEHHLASILSGEG